ncbi:MAG: hypothetical protein JWO05_3803 [Gemmatimonadetes bacterium]|nr:hypothetical protein [Gemmatimonadota bacterium]
MLKFHAHSDLDGPNRAWYICPMSQPEPWKGPAAWKVNTAVLVAVAFFVAMGAYAVVLQSREKSRRAALAREIEAFNRAGKPDSAAAAAKRGARGHDSLRVP